MRIAFLANAASVHTARWVNELAVRGHEIHLIFIRGHEPDLHTIRDDISLHRLLFGGVKGYTLNALQCNRILESIKADIVNAHYASGYGTLARLAKANPLLLSVWGSDVYDFPNQSKLKNKILIKNLLFAKEIASTSHCMADRVEDLLRGYDYKIHVTPFGVELNHFQPVANKVSRDVITIGNIKSLAPHYGLDDFILAIRILIDRLVEEGEKVLAAKIRGIVYGEGNQREMLENLIQEYHLSEIIVLPGSIPNTLVPSALREIDVFCATSHRESFGVSVVEAMAAGLPVVATNTPGFREVVIDGETGFIVENMNPKAIADALHALIMDPEMKERFGKKGREKVEQHFNWQDNVDKMLSVYESVIAL